MILGVYDGYAELGFGRIRMAKGPAFDRSAFIKLNDNTAIGVPLLASYSAPFHILFAGFLSPP